jgi:beta-phosphoglucomutase family hydrolase
MPSGGRLGIPATVSACLFDLDGVITQTAQVHAKAWKEVFDPLVPRPFDPIHDYEQYVDGKPREDGVRSFLQSRHITLDEGAVHDLAQRKDQIFLDLIRKNGVQTFEGTVRYIKAARREGLKTAVVSSSKHTTEVLKAAGLEQQRLFDAQVDGNVAEREHLRGKPAPDTYLKAAHLLGTEPLHGAVYEDAIAGVEAGREGGFGLVVGIDRQGQATELKNHGADIVVNDLADLMTYQP